MNRPKIIYKIVAYSKRSFVHKIKVIIGFIHFSKNRLLERQTGPVALVLSKGRKGHARSVASMAQSLGYRVVILCPEFPINECKVMSGWHKMDCEQDFARGEEIVDALNPNCVLIESKHSLLPMQNHLANRAKSIAVGSTALTTSNSKTSMRDALEKASVGTVWWHSINGDCTPQLPKDSAFVYKPEVGSGSAGVRYLASDTAAIELLKDDNKSSGVIEQFVQGRQFDLEGIAIDGHYYPICLTEEHYGDAAPFFPASWFLFNAPISNHDANLLWDNAKSALRALGVINGAWHIEQRIDKASQEVIVLDYANRMGYNRLITAASGRSFPYEYISAMNGKVPETAEEEFKIPTRSLLKIYAFNKDELEVMINFAETYPDMLFQIRKKKQTIGDWTFEGFIICHAKTFEELYIRLNKAKLLPKKIADYYGHIINDS